jgi:hypothetical protein
MLLQKNQWSKQQDSGGIFAFTCSEIYTLQNEKSKKTYSSLGPFKGPASGTTLKQI